MLKSEFENLTGLTVNEDEYIQVIEPKYMKSKLDKKSWCTQYLNTLRYDRKAVNKKEIKDCLKEWLENWHYSEKVGGIWYDQYFTFDIKYRNGDLIRVSEMDYNGESIKLQGIENISMICSECHMDFYYDWIGDKESFEFILEMNRENPNSYMWDIPKNRLVVEDLDDYYKEFEAKTELKGVA